MTELTETKMQSQLELSVTNTRDDHKEHEREVTEETKVDAYDHIKRQIDECSQKIEQNKDSPHLYHERYKLYMACEQFADAQSDAQKMIECGVICEGFLNKADATMAEGKGYDTRRMSYDTRRINRLYDEAMTQCHDDDEKQKIQEKQRTYDDATASEEKGLKHYETCKRLIQEPFGDYHFKEIKQEISAAIEEYTRAIDLCPHYVSCYEHRCDAYILYGEYEAALDSIKSLRKLADKKTEEISLVKQQNNDKHAVVFGENWNFFCFLLWWIGWLWLLLFAENNEVNSFYFTLNVIIVSLTRFLWNWILAECTSISKYEDDKRGAGTGLIMMSLVFYEIISLIAMMLYTSMRAGRDQGLTTYSTMPLSIIFNIFVILAPFQHQSNKSFLVSKHYDNYYLVCCGFMGLQLWSYWGMHGFSGPIYCHHDELNHDFCFFSIAYLQHLTIITVVLFFIYICVMRELVDDKMFYSTKQRAEVVIRREFGDDQHIIDQIHDIAYNSNEIEIFSKLCCRACINCGDCGTCGLHLYRCNLPTIYCLVTSFLSAVIGFIPLIFVDSNIMKHDHGLSIFFVVVNSLIVMFGSGLFFTTLYRMIVKLYHMDQIMAIFAEDINVECINDIKKWWHLRQYALKWHISVMYNYLEFGVGALFLSTLLLTIWIFVEIFFPETDENNDPYQFFTGLPQRNLAVIFAIFTPISMIMTLIIFNALIKPYKKQDDHLTMLRKELLKLQMKQNSNGVICNAEEKELYTKQEEIKETFIMIDCLENVIYFCEKSSVYPRIMGTKLDGRSLELFRGYIMAIIIAFAGKMLSSRFK